MNEIKVGKLTFKITEVGSLSVIACEKDATEITVPSRVDGKIVVSIGKGAFEGCTELRSIELPQFNFEDWLTNPSQIFGIILEDAFRGCTSLEKIWIPASVDVIYGGTFAGCTSLKEVTRGNLPYDTELVVRSYAFDGCVALESLPENREDRLHATRGCISLNSPYDIEIAATATAEVTLTKDKTTIESPGYFAVNPIKSVTFEDPEGWYVKFNDSMPMPELPLDLSSPERNARMLRNATLDSSVIAIYKK